MSRELEHATREAWAMVALLETQNMPHAAGLAEIRAEALDDALAMIGRAAAQGDQPEEDQAEEPGDPPPAPPADSLASFGLTPDEIEEAHRMLNGPGGGARKLAEWFGMTLGRAQDLADALRAQAKGQAA